MYCEIKKIGKVDLWLHARTHFQILFFQGFGMEKYSQFNNNSKTRIFRSKSPQIRFTQKTKER